MNASGNEGNTIVSLDLFCIYSLPRSVFVSPLCSACKRAGVAVLAPPEYVLGLELMRHLPATPMAELGTNVPGTARIVHTCGNRLKFENWTTHYLRA